jgi:hypothetical protein
MVACLISSSPLRLHSQRRLWWMPDDLSCNHVISRLRTRGYEPQA